MPSPLNEIYDSVFAFFREGKVTVPWVDIDIGQLEDNEIGFPIKFPAVLVKFEDIIWKKKDDAVQEGLVNVTVKVIFKFTKEVEMYQPQNTRQEVKTFIDSLNAIHDGLKEISGGGFSKLIRYNQYQEKTKPKDLLWVQVLQYQCNIQSDGAIEDPNALHIDYDDVKNNNAFMERKKFNLIHK